MGLMDLGLVDFSPLCLQHSKVLKFGLRVLLLLELLPLIFDWQLALPLASHPLSWLGRRPLREQLASFWSRQVLLVLF